MRYPGNSLRRAALITILVIAAHASTACARNNVQIFVHFFDWFHEKTWQEDRIADKLDWQAIGVNGPGRSSEKFYFKQFEYIKSIGIDALAWEYHPRRGMHATYPSPAAIRALKRSGLKIAPFYYLEIAFKFKRNGKMIGTLSNPDAIQANSETVVFMTGQLKEFFAHVPNSLLATDKKGRQVNFDFGYGFDDRNLNPAAWSSFADRLVASVGGLSKGDPVFYWTAKNSVFEEHLFLHHRDHFVPFQFVLDTPQSQFGYDSVTWNFGFDNQLVLAQDGLQRVVRLDPRYVQEMGWLSKAADPSLVFIYGWDVPFEGSLLLPTKHWGDTKARLAEEYIRRLRLGSDPPLPKTLLIVDDLDAYWGGEKGRLAPEHSSRHAALPDETIRTPGRLADGFGNQPTAARSLPLYHRRVFHEIGAGLVLAAGENGFPQDYGVRPARQKHRGHSGPVLCRPRQFAGVERTRRTGRRRWESIRV